MLSGVRVIALENYLAGNYGTMLLAMLGAEVIKIESPPTGDALRGNSPYIASESGRRSHGELRLMVGKRSVCLDVRTPEGRRLFEALLEQSDVFWSNLRPQSLERLDISFDQLQGLNPRLIYATLSGFGHSDVLPPGPSYEVSAFDLIAQGMAGLQFRPEGEGRSPVYNGIAIGDQVTSVYTVLGIVAALHQRTVTGRGDRVDVAMYDCMVALNEKALGLYTLFGEVPIRGESGTSAPYGAFQARDGFVNIAVGGDPVWVRFCAALDRPDLVDHPRYASAGDRVRHYVEINDIVTEWTRSKAMAEIVDLLGAHQVPCARLQEVDEIVADPQVAARQMLFEYDDPIAGQVRIPGNPIKSLSGVDPEYGVPPTLGQDTREVLRRVLDLKDEEVDELHAAGVVRAPSASSVDGKGGSTGPSREPSRRQGDRNDGAIGAVGG